MDSVHRIEKKIVKKNFQDFFFCWRDQSIDNWGILFFPFKTHRYQCVCMLYIGVCVSVVDGVRGQRLSSLVCSWVRDIKCETVTWRFILNEQYGNWSFFYRPQISPRFFLPLGPLRQVPYGSKIDLTTSFVARKLKTKLFVFFCFRILFY